MASLKVVKFKMPLKLRDLFTDDLDKVFSYRTQRFVVIKDIYLGCAHKFFQILILLYVLIIAVWLNEGYISKEYSTSQSATVIERGGSELVSSRDNQTILVDSNLAFLESSAEESSSGGAFFA
jgi:hypothetical protein